MRGWKSLRCWAMAAQLTGCGGSDDAKTTETTDAVRFEVKITNVSDSADVPTPIAPGVWVRHTGDSPLFVLGEEAPENGLESLAEDGSPDALLSSVESEFESGGFSLGSEEYKEGAADPGDHFTFSFDASPGDRLGFAAMFVQSNDYFVGAPDGGLELFDSDGEPISGEVHVIIYNAGTEVDQPLGEGADQAPRQSGPDTGEDEEGVVQDSGLVARDYVTVTVMTVE